MGGWGGWGGGGGRSCRKGGGEVVVVGFLYLLFVHQIPPLSPAMVLSKDKEKDQRTGLDRF